MSCLTNKMDGTLFQQKINKWRTYSIKEGQYKQECFGGSWLGNETERSDDRKYAVETSHTYCHQKVSAHNMIKKKECEKN